jgi:hypothetical protein
MFSAAMVLLFLTLGGSSVRSPVDCGPQPTVSITAKTTIKTNAFRAGLFILLSLRIYSIPLCIQHMSKASFYLNSFADI